MAHAQSHEPFGLLCRLMKTEGKGCARVGFVGHLETEITENKK